MVRIGLDVPCVRMVMYCKIIRSCASRTDPTARCLGKCDRCRRRDHHPDRRAIKLAGYPPIALTIGLLQGGLIRSPDNNLLPFRDLQISIEVE